MTRDALSTVSTRATSQREAATPEQVQNSAGGFTFEITDRVRLNRFLVLGSDGATYYASAKDLTKDNAEVVLRMAVSDGITLVNDIVSVSEAGRAPKANPALFALAIAASHGNDETRKAALDALPRVARIGTHLFIFARYVEQFRGWGRGLRRAVAKWYERDTDDVTFQVLKYRTLMRPAATRRKSSSSGSAVGRPMARVRTCWTASSRRRRSARTFRHSFVSTG